MAKRTIVDGQAIAQIVSVVAFFVLFLAFFSLDGDRAGTRSPNHVPRWCGWCTAILVLGYGNPWFMVEYFRVPCCAEFRQKYAAVACVHLVMFALVGRSKVFLLAPASTLLCCLQTFLPSSWSEQVMESQYLAEYVMQTIVILAMRPSGMNILGYCPPLSVFALMALGCIVTAVVLNQWSEATRKGSDDHIVVKGYVDGTGSTRVSLSWRQHVRLAMLSFWDGIGQEMIWRGMFLHELLAVGAFDPATVNILQALSFGMIHWNGIPSGWSGIGLTFVYGWFMGWLVIRLHGMMLALLVHWFADYFIYTVIARKQFD